MGESFNLLDERWIPVLWNDGRYGRVGIKEAITKAASIREIAASNPMDRVALIRFLLAVLYWCKGNPEPEDTTHDDAPFPTSWFSKLDQHTETFNLLGDGERFYQDQGKRTVPTEDTTKYFFQEMPSGNNWWHLRHVTDGIEAICPACCAVGLVRLPVFTQLGGLGKGTIEDTYKYVGVNGPPPIYAVPIGPTLAVTLRLSWQHTQWPIGTPEWETPNMPLPKQGQLPLLTALTWLPRRVWLGPPADPPRHCIICGHKDRLIRVCAFDGKGKNDSSSRTWHDPHVVYSNDLPPRSTLAPDLVAPGKFALDRPWSTPLSRLIANRAPAEKQATCQFLMVGFAVVKGKSIDVWERRISLAVPNGPPDTAAPLAAQWDKECTRLPSRFFPPREKGDKAKARNVELTAATVSALRPHVEHQVSAGVAELLSGGEEVWQRAAAEYGPMMQSVAKSLAPGVSATAAANRLRIASIIPNMSATFPTTPRKSRTKGGKE